MNTGPTNEKTRKLVVDLEKHGKKTKKRVWRVLSEKLAGSTRRRPSVNVYKLSELAKRNEGRILVIAGKVLAKGNADTKIEVACFACSGKAKAKIEAAKGRVWSLAELMESKPKENRLVIVQ